MITTKWSEELIEDAIRTFKPRAEKLGEVFTRDEAVESLNNIANLFELLMRFDREQRKVELPRLINILRGLQTKRANQNT